MKPEPPELSHTARELSLTEILWTVKNGIRHSGMPALGSSHSHEELQAIAAFVSELDDMSADEYRRWTTGASEPGALDDESSTTQHDDHSHGG